MKRLLLALSFVLMSVGSIAHADSQMPDGPVSWFEIPVTKMDRAMAFYNKVLAVELKLDTSHGAPMAFFPMKPKQTSGALVQIKGFTPGATGTVVYLNGGDNLQPMLDRVVPAGGKIVVQKTHIPDVGFFAIFIDTEGNQLGLYSPN